MGKILEELLTQKVAKIYQEQGFRLYEIDDHILALDKDDVPIATFSAAGITNANEQVNEACKKFIETGRAW